jgi:hypothetical protein
MARWIILIIALSLLVSQGGRCFLEIKFEGKEIDPVEDISLCASTQYLYLAYTPPDSTTTCIMKLNPDLEELRHIEIDPLLSPDICMHDMTLYLAGIRDTELVIMALTGDLEKIDEHTISLEEPVDVCISPVADGFYLSYVDRYFEEGLLRQDIFIKKLDYAFQEIAQNRITFDSFWEEPNLALCEGTVFLSYANAPIMSFLNRYIVIGEIDSQLHLQNEKRIPVESTADRNLTQPSVTATDTELLLFFRESGKDFTISRFTWEGMVTRRIGNIRGVTLTPELERDEDIVVTRDCWEQYTPSALSAFGKIYLSYAEIQKDGQLLKIISADTPHELRQPPPHWWETSPYWIIIPVLLGILIVYILTSYYRNRRKTNRKKEENKSKKEKKKKE